MSNALAVFGAGGHGRVVADCAQALGWSRIVFFDDAFSKGFQGTIWPCEGRGDELVERASHFDGVIIAIGNNGSRLAWHERLDRAGAHLVSLIHPAAWVSPGATMGAGTVIFAGGIVNIGASLGRSVIINTGATVDHDCILADGVHVSPGCHLSGNVRVGTCSWLGAGSVVREGIQIGADVTVGMGAAVIYSGATPSAGRRNSGWMSGMSKTRASGST